MTKPMVKLDDVCFSYDKEMVLNHLSMTVEKSSLCFIMGINGSGKTTLLKSIMGFLFPQRGIIQINGIDVATVNRYTMSRLVSYVPQAINLNTDFTVMDYLSLGRTPHLGFAAKMKESDYEIIDRYSARLGVRQFLEIPFNNLSGGQKQMVAVTRSLVQDTPLIILDEPMSALDIGKQVELLQVLRELISEGKTIILTTHNPNHALALKCDVCFLKQGMLIARGNSRETINNGLLQEIYGNNISLECGKNHSFVVFNTETM